MKIMRGLLPSIFQARSAPTLRPSFAPQTSTAHSAARIPERTSPAKSKLPGVSSTLIFTFLYFTGATAREMEMLLLISSAS